MLDTYILPLIALFVFWALIVLVSGSYSKEK